MFLVRNKATGKYLRMSRFEPGTQNPVYGEVDESWIADSKEQVIAQASFLGDGIDHEVVELVVKSIG